jgi:hypothetical protein
MRKDVVKEVPLEGFLGIFLKYQMINYSDASFKENARIVGRTGVRESLKTNGRFTFSGHYTKRELTGVGKATLSTIITAIIGLSYLVLSE